MTDDFDFDFDVNPDGPGPEDGPSGDAPKPGNGKRKPSSEPPPLVYRDEGEEPSAPSRPRPVEPSGPAPSGGEADGGGDWLSLADGDADLDAMPGPHADNPAPDPREGRELARGARRRATGRPEEKRRSAPDGDFESVLESQPQKSAAAQRGSAILYGARGLFADGGERLRGGLSSLRGVPERVKESLPSSVSGGGVGGAPRGPSSNGAAGGNGDGPRLPRHISSRRPKKPKPGRVKKLRLAIILVGMGALAMTSTVFGMMMAVAGDLPNLESKEQYSQAKNSEVFDSRGRKMGTLLSNSRRILVDSEDISPYVKQAVVAIEDERFYEHRGVDFRGVARAVAADIVPGGSTQGASTITQQFVKNALEAQGSRTVFQKLRESALAYHLERQWDKDKILTQYLNTIYYGEGAYGVEAAARTYFGKQHPECMSEGATDPCASVLAPEEAAMLAGIITSPSAFSPRANPQDALARRNLVLQKMVEQDTLDEGSYENAIRVALPGPSDIERPAEDSLSPYFTSWLRQQLVDRYGAGRAFGGGLDVMTTLDLDMQTAAESAAYNTLSGIEPTSAVVVIDNKTGGVRALVGGNDFEQEPFNLATNGLRQPGSSFKPFTLATAFQNGFNPSSTFTSEKRYFTVPNSGGKEEYQVNNYDDIYYGTSDLTSATIHSDNSIFAELGFGDQGMGRRGPQKVAETAHKMGIETDISTNQAMILGAPSPGVTPLEMAYAYTTFSHDGQRISGSLDTIPGNESIAQAGPVAITKIRSPDGTVLDENTPKEWRAIPQSVAETVRSILHLNVLQGTGKRAQFGDSVEWGKTGTTENNGDAWFCGGSENLTACVWVGHAQTNTPMETEFGGLPVDGGTFPALIWAQVMSACESIYANEEADDKDGDIDSSGSPSTPTYTPDSSGSSGSTGGGDTGGGGGAPKPSTPAPAPAPSGGGGTGGTGGTGL